MTAPELSVLLQAVALSVLITSVTLFYVQMRKTQEWNRRKASQDMLFQIVTGDIAKLRERMQLDLGVKLDDEAQTYQTLYDSLPDNKKRLELDACSKALFNYFEAIAIGIKNHVLEEDICYDQVGLAFLVYWKWGDPYITAARMGYPTIFLEFDHYVQRWTRIYNEQLQKMRSSGRERI